MAVPFLDAAYPFAISLALGALVGVERERTRLHGAGEGASLPGGVRTFPLFALLGCTLAWLGEHYGPPVFAVGLAGFALLVVAIYVVTSLGGDVGATTEAAAFLTFVVGAMVYAGEPLLASAIAVAMTVLLSARERLHDLARKIEAEDLYAALTLAVVTVIVLPLLPDRGYGPWAVWNPFRIWLLVVFISAIGFGGYVGVKLLGAGRGIALAGLFGGIVSSTAATLSMSGRSKEEPGLSRAFAAGIALAWGAMFVRVIAEVAAVDAALLERVLPPIAAAAVTGLAGAGIATWHANRASGTAPAAYRNPFRLVSALKFAFLFGAVLIVAKAAQVRFQDKGVLVAAALTGLFDVDAMTLSAARLSKEGQLAPATAASAVFLAAGANTVMKAALALALGAGALRRVLLPIAAATLLFGGAVAVALGRG
jgi:uncharacterized membrane protein (DUF4010 family)